ncbi:MAG: hypothetical protein ACOX2O_04330 [Bdellovibrionota bacterium]|jgi:predicted  nucleic acid-binding Zn-ribbon protein
MKCLFRTLLLLLCSTTAVMAEDEPLRGRLPDGRAYRTDAQGVRIIDYIAELELSVEDLSRQIQDLESELERRGGRRSQGADVEKKDGALVEKDILVDSVVAEGVQVEGVKVEEVKAPTCPPDRSIELERKLQEAEQRIFTLQNEAAELRSAQSTPHNLCVEEKGEILKLRAEVEAADKEIQRYKSNLANATTAVQSRTVKAPPAVSQVASQPKARYAPPKPDAFTNLRSELQAEYNRLQRSISRRNTKYRQYQTKAKSVKFKLSSLRSANNKTLESIKYGIKHEKSLPALKALRVDLRQIAKRVNDDIALIDRLIKTK